MRNKELGTIKEILNTDPVICDSVEYRTELLRRAMAEYQTRKNLMYYNYSPSSPKHYDFHFCGKKIRINVGANRAGKTTCAVWDLISVSIGEHPVYKIKTPCTGWVVGSSFSKIKDVLFPKFEKMLPQNRVKEITCKPRSNEYRIVFDNGSDIIFKSMEQDVGAFTSASIHWALVDERFSDEDKRNQLRMRIADTDGLLVFTGDRLEDDEWIEDLAKFDYSQVFKFEFEDNARYLPLAEIKRLRRELDPIEQEKLLNGNFQNKYGEQRFKDNIFTELNYIMKEPARVNVELGKMVAYEDGYFRIFEEPIDGIQYIIGIDVAEGSGWNHTAMECFKNNGEQVFEFMTNQIPFQRLPEIIGDIGKLYNKALVVVENKSYGVTVIDRLKDFYPNLYIEPTYRGNRFRKMGWGISTEAKIKENMIVNAVDFLANNKCMIHSEKLVRQLKRFITDKNTGKTKGLKRKDDPEMMGNDDDNVMAFLFAMWALNSTGIYKRYEYNKNKSVTSRLSIDKNNLTRYYRIGDRLETYNTSSNYW